MLGNFFLQFVIGEYKVFSFNYKVEFDQVSLVVIIVIIKLGINEFYGEGFFDFINQLLCDVWLIEIFGVNLQGKVKIEDKQFGGVFGGLIVKDFVYFFVSYEGKCQLNLVDILFGNGEQILVFLMQYQGLFGIILVNFKEDLYFGKLDLVFIDKDLFELIGKYCNELFNGFGNGIEVVIIVIDMLVKEICLQLCWEYIVDIFVNDFKIGYEDVKWSQVLFVNEFGVLFQWMWCNVNGDISWFDLLCIGGGIGLQ